MEENDPLSDYPAMSVEDVSFEGSSPRKSLVISVEQSQDSNNNIVGSLSRGGGQHSPTTPAALSHVSATNADPSELVRSK